MKVISDIFLIKVIAYQSIKCQKHLLCTFKWVILCCISVPLLNRKEVKSSTLSFFENMSTWRICVLKWLRGNDLFSKEDFRFRLLSGCHSRPVKGVLKHQLQCLKTITRLVEWGKMVILYAPCVHLLGVFSQRTTSIFTSEVTVY